MSPDPESFEALLAWLDPDDRDAAGRKYQIIHAGLVRVFVSKGCNDAEHLADETFDRGMRRLSDIGDTYEGYPENYLYGIVRNILREQGRLKEIATDEFPVILREEKVPSDEFTCLLKCLDLLPVKRRELILDYHVYSGHEKVAQHGVMADELSISENALRVRACHIRADLRECVTECTKNLGGKQNLSANA